MGVDLLIFTAIQVVLGALIFLSAMAMLLFIFIVVSYLSHLKQNYINRQNNKGSNG